MEGAFKEEPKAPTAKTYRVSGDRSVLGWEPGDEFSEPIPEEQERRLIQRGQLEVVGEEVFSEADELNNGEIEASSTGASEEDGNA